MKRKLAAYQAGNVVCQYRALGQWR